MNYFYRPFPTTDLLCNIGKYNHCIMIMLNTKKEETIIWELISGKETTYYLFSTSFSCLKKQRKLKVSYRESRL